jgi:hypothetical protein
MPGGAARGMTRGTPGEKPLPTQKISIKGPLGQVNPGWGVVIERGKVIHPRVRFRETESRQIKMN